MFGSEATSAPPPKVACNSTDHIFLITQKHWNHNETISIPKRLIGKLHATLLGNQDDAPYKIRLRPVQVVTLCTRYGAVHPIRKGVMLTDRVHHPIRNKPTCGPARMDVDGPDRCRAQGRQGLAGLRDDTPGGPLAARCLRGAEPQRGDHTQRARARGTHTTRPGPATQSRAAEPRPHYRQSDQAIHHQVRERLQRGLRLTLGQRRQRGDRVVRPGASELAGLFEHVVAAQLLND